MLQSFDAPDTNTSESDHESEAPVKKRRLRSTKTFSDKRGGMDLPSCGKVAARLPSFLESPECEGGRALIQLCFNQHPTEFQRNTLCTDLHCENIKHMLSVRLLSTALTSSKACSLPDLMNFLITLLRSFFESGVKDSTQPKIPRFSCLRGCALVHARISSHNGDEVL